MTTTYNLYDIVKDIIKSTNPKEYIKKIKEKSFMYGFYLIEKDNLIKILLKAKSNESKTLINKLKNNINTGYELSKDTLVNKYENSNKNYFDFGTSLINYEKNKVRFTIDNDGNLYFRAKDICIILGYSDIKQVIKQIDDNLKINYGLIPRGGVCCTPPLWNESELTLYLNEAGLYSLIFKSNKKEAKIFTNWVCNDVLPSLRKHGIYKMNNNKKLENYDNKNCFYLFNVKKNIYKFGITKNIRRRMNEHKNNNLLKNVNDITEIFLLDNYNQLMNLENNFKQYIKNNKMNIKLDSYNEIFETSNIKNELEFIKKYIKEQNNKKEIDYTSSQSILSMEILRLQNDNLAKQIELEQLKLKNKELDVKLEQLKSKKQNITINADTIQQINKCIDCSVDISGKHKRCNKCEGKRRFNMNLSNRPTYEQLLKDKEELKYFTKIGKKYNVSDNSVRKWFKMYEKYN